MLNIAQLLISITLIAVILLQVKGAGMGGAFGQASAGFRTRRGLDKTLFNMTIMLIIVFVLVSVINVKFG